MTPFFFLYWTDFGVDSLGENAWNVLCVALVVPALLFSLWRGHQNKRELDLFLLEEGICPKCFYDLTANESGVCPECGISLDVRRNRPK